jgi:hypothetical protein
MHTDHHRVIRPPSAVELLNAWEQGISQSPTRRALTLLAVACPDLSHDALARMSIGRRDGYLLTLREWMFGSQLTSLADCHHCGEQLELSFDVADVRATPEREFGDMMTLQLAEYTARFRLPNSLDALAASEGDIAMARRMLLERCVLDVQYNGAAMSPVDLPPDLIDALIARMAQDDPQADIELDLTCPACGQTWRATFDIVSFFWNEINTWAYRMLRDVHALATSYGWREADIVAMSPWRRQVYLDMVSG